MKKSTKKVVTNVKVAAKKPVTNKAKAKPVANKAKAKKVAKVAQVKKVAAKKSCAKKAK